MDAKEFKSARKEMGFSQKALAEHWNMGDHGHRSIRRWEQGNRPLNPIAAHCMSVMIEHAALQAKTIKPAA